MRRLLLLLVPLAASFSWTAFAQETATPIPIPILNPGFEEDELFCTTCSYFGATGWIVAPQSGVFKPSTTQFPGGVPDGVNVGYAGNVHSTGSFLQTLGVPLRTNTIYTLSLSIGQRADLAMTGYIAALMAGNVTLAFDNTLSPPPGTFLTDVIVYDSGANPPSLGKPLQILVKSVGTGQVDFDNVSLTGYVSPTATPQ